MSTTPLIQSRQNPCVQALARLRERRERDAQGRFPIEGLRELSRALASKTVVEEVYFCPEVFKNPQATTQLLEDARQQGIVLRELGGSAFEKVSGREGVDGLLGVGRAWNLSLDTLALPFEPLLLVVEAVEKPGNLGALFRTADSAGCAALICCDPVADIFNPNVIRASQGSVFSVPCALGTSGEVATFLRERGIKVFATTPTAKKHYWDADLRGAAAILLGGERDGLSPFWLQGGARADLISIPQAGLSDSLNVGMAGAICLFEAVRQRRIVH